MRRSRSAWESSVTEMSAAAGACCLIAAADACVQPARRLSVSAEEKSDAPPLLIAQERGCHLCALSLMRSQSARGGRRVTDLQSGGSGPPEPRIHEAGGERRGAGGEPGGEVALRLRRGDACGEREERVGMARRFGGSAEAAWFCGADTVSSEQGR